MLSMRRTLVDPHAEESEEQMQPSLLTIIEIAGGPVSWEQLLRMVAMVVKKTLRKGQDTPIIGEEAAQVEVMLASKHMTQISIRVSLTYRVKKGTTYYI